MQLSWRPAMNNNFVRGKIHIEHHKDLDDTVMENHVIHTKAQSYLISLYLGQSKSILVGTSN